MKRISLAVFLSFLALASLGQTSKKAMKQLIDDNFSFAANQYKVLMKNVPPTLMPRTYNPAKQELVTSNTKWWCSGFYPGTLWLIYDGTKDKAIREEAEKRLAILEDIKSYTGNNDL